MRYGMLLVLEKHWIGITRLWDLGPNQVWGHNPELIRKRHHNLKWGVFRVILKVVLIQDGVIGTES